MKVVRDDLWLCVDCLFAAVNGDVTAIDRGSEEKTQARIDEVWKGLEKLGGHLVPDFDSESEEGIEEFSTRGCDACDSPLAGQMHRFAILGES